MIGIEEGATAKEIGKELGRSFRSVQQKLNELGIRRDFTGRKPDTYRTLRIVNLIEKLGTVSSVARAMGILETSVAMRVKILVAEGVLIRVGGRTSAGYFTTSKTWKQMSAQS